MERVPIRLQTAAGAVGLHDRADQTLLYPRERHEGLRFRSLQRADLQFDAIQLGMVLQQKRLDLNEMGYGKQIQWQTFHHRH